MAENRSWMYDRVHMNRGGLKPSFLEGLNEFINVCERTDDFIRVGKVRCPCAKCKCTKFKSTDGVKHDLMMNGFVPNYWVWVQHGEQSFELGHGYGVSEYSYNDNVGGLGTWEGNAVRYEEMVIDAFQQPNLVEEEEEPNPDAYRFYRMLESVRSPLWDGSVHSKLSIATRMLGIKAENNHSQYSFEQMATLVREIAPNPSDIPKNYYEAKKIVSQLGLKAVKIDCCINSCMIFYKDDESLTECKFCNSPRFDSKKRTKNVPFRRMHYLPLIPRLQRLYASMSSAPHMRWHFDNHRNDNVMTHPSHGEAWLHFDRKHPTFAVEPRNVRLGLCSDGFAPNIHFSLPYSCWPVIVTPYNLPPEMCMKDPYLFLTCVIPGPDNPKAKIDVFLQPLIDELNDLWLPGVLTYDVSTKTNFLLRAALMWTINDFPAYGMLSGWMTQGRLSCPICMEDTKAFQLKYGGKKSWFDCHRRFLPEDHPYRRNRYAFRKNTEEHEDPPVRLTGEQVWSRVRRYPRIVDTGCQIQLSGYGNEHN